MLEAFGETQRNLLKTLYHSQEGVSPQALVEKLGVTRTAVNQHLDALEGLGVIETGPTVATGGRPTRTFCLSEKGIGLFPKQYTWFTELLLQSVKEQEVDLGKWMRTLGASVGASVVPKIESLQGEERLAAIVGIMNDLFYEATLSDEGTRIQATNCVYHGLAAKFSEVCQFDIAMLSKLSGREAIHEKCIVRGDSCCRFSFAEKKANEN